MISVTLGRPRPSDTEPHSSQHAIDSAALSMAAQASTNAAEALGRMDRHEAECSRRWGALQKEFRVGLCAIVLLLLSVIGWLLSHGAPWEQTKEKAERSAFLAQIGDVFLNL